MKKRDAKPEGADEVVAADEPAPVVEEAPAQPAPAPPAAEVRTAEAWAEAKRLFPEFIEQRHPFARADAPAVRSHNPQFWRFHAIQVGMGWPIGKELTEAEFDAALLTLEPSTGHQYR